MTNENVSFDGLISVKDLLSKFSLKFGQIETRNIFARILRGKFESDFETLTNSPFERKVVFPIDYNGLLRFEGKSTSKALQMVGYPKILIEQLLSEGYEFRLIVFAMDACETEETNDTIIIADWDNSIRMVSKLYPLIADKILGVIDDLKNTPYGLLAKEFIPEKMTYEKLCSLKGTPSQVRQFLMDTLCFTEFYSGTGLTCINPSHFLEGNIESSKIGVCEYLMQNRSLSKLKHIIIKLQ